jgi:cytochrome c-type biogenesis protein CcmH/NrfG
VAKHLESANKEDDKTHNTYRFALILLLFIVIAVGAYAYVKIRLYSHAQHTRQQHQEQPLSWRAVDSAMECLDYDKALSLAQQITATNPDYYYGHLYLGNIHLARGQFDKAESEYSQAYELFPSEDTEKYLSALRKRRERQSPSPSSPK